MKYWPLVWVAFSRRKARTVITLLSIVVAFLLFGVLYGTLAEFDSLIDSMSDERLEVQNRVSLIQELPIAYLSQVQSLPGVRQVAPYTWMGGYYQDARKQVATIAIDVPRYLECYPEIVLSAGALEAMVHEPAGAIVGKDLAKRFGWKVGDHVPLRSNRPGRDPRITSWSFDIVGFYSIKGAPQPANQFLINYDYFESAISGERGRVTLLIVVPKAGVNAVKLRESIDRHFANSSDETLTQSEKEFGRAGLAQIGDIRLFVISVVGAVFFTLLFLTGNTMHQSIRERIPELAVLKACGIRDRTVSLLVVSESLLLCLAGAVAGIGLAAVVLPRALQAAGMPGVSFRAAVAGFALLIAAAVALVSVAAPLRRVTAIRVADALAGH